MKKPGMAAYPEVSSVIALHGIFTGAFLGFIDDHHAGITSVLLVKTGIYKKEDRRFFHLPIL